MIAEITKNVIEIERLLCEEIAEAGVSAIKEFVNKVELKAFQNNYCQDIVLKNDIINIATEMGVYKSILHNTNKEI